MKDVSGRVIPALPVSIYLYFFPNRFSWLGQEEITFSTN